MDLRPLPVAALELIETLDAPPRLVAHLALVHDAAFEILESIQARWPELSINRDAVLFGAATHDLGKVLHSAELVGPGNQHEQDGPELLQQHGVPAVRARFARTHGSWASPGLALEDLIVALADCCWKGARSEELERKVASQIAGALGLEIWEVFLGLDDILAEIASHGEERLAWQGANRG